MLKHFLNFKTYITTEGIREIDEPIGFASAGFNIKQDEGRKGRDVIFSGNGEAQFSLSKLNNHFFEEILEIRRRYGFEANVQYMVDFGDGIQVVGDIDFSTLTTNQVDTLEFTVVQVTEEALFKRRFDTNVNLFSARDLDGNVIAPVQTHDMFLKAKPIRVVSEWSNPRIGYFRDYNNPSQNADYFNVFKQQIKYDIQDSLSWLEDYNDDNNGAFENFIYLEAKTNLKDIKIEFNIDVLIQYLPQLNNSLTNKAGQVLLRVYYGQSETDYQQINAWNSTAFQGTTNQSQQFPSQWFIDVPFLNNTDKLWISFVSATRNGAVNRIRFGEGTVKITATAISYSSIVPVVRYIDAIKYAVKATCGMDVIAPRWDVGGEFYEQYITTAQLMRNLRNKPFNITNKSIVEDNIRPEVNGDYQIQPDNKVLFDIYEGFYRNYEIAVFYEGMYEDYSFDVNQRFTVNTLNVEFKNYASQKENEQDNTFDIVHGSLQILTPNKNVENSRDISIGFNRDAFLMEQNRQKGYDTSDNTATSDDGKIFIIDAVPLPPATQYTETAELQHQADGQVLVLRNTGNFTWTQLMGVASYGNIFTILSGNNAGLYFVQSVTDRELTLLRPAGTPVDILTDNTSFKYTPSTTVKLTNRTNEGFSTISNLADGNNYANLRFTSARIARKYYNSELATIQMYQPNKPSKVTLYKNNPDAITQITGEESIKEGGEFVPTNPILTPNEYTVQIVMSINKWWELQNKVRLERGYIRFFDPNGLPIKIYLKEAEWTPLTPEDKYYSNDELLGVANIVGEERFEPFYMEIFADEQVFMINGQIQPSGFTFSLDDFGFLRIFDLNGKLLHVPVPYDKVKFNGSSNFNSPDDLGLALSPYDAS